MFLAGEKISGLLKYPTYDKEQQKRFKDNIFDRQNMPYDLHTDPYLCPNGKRLIYKEDVAKETQTRFQYTTRKYECEKCNGCPMFDKCTPQKEGEGNQTIQVNENLEAHKRCYRRKIQS